MEQDRDGITVSKILQFADLRDKEVLEIGCGDGRITSQLVEKTKDWSQLIRTQRTLLRGKKT